MILFIDFVKNSSRFSKNYYLEESKLILKIPMTIDKRNKIDEFNLSKYTYLIHYE